MPTAYKRSQSATQVKIYNLSLPAANTEVPQALSMGVKGLLIRARGNSITRVAFGPTETATKFWTIYKGAGLELTEMDIGSLSLYASCSLAGEILEITEKS